MSGFNDISNTSGPGSSAEPSMEEILASIRRILKEDESGRAAAPKVDIEDDVLVLDASMLAKPPDLSSAAALSPTELPAEMGAQPEVPVISYHNEMHIASEPARLDFDTAPPEPAALYAPLPVMPDGSVVPGWPEPAPAPALEMVTLPAAPQKITPEQPDVDESAAEERDAQEGSSSAAPEQAMSDSYEAPAPIISDTAAQAAKQSIGALVRNISMERAVAVSRGGTTIEDIVREEIRPMLKAWLDTHLPTLVERIVRAEIERVVDRTQL